MSPTLRQAEPPRLMLGQMPDMYYNFLMVYCVIQKLLSLDGFTVVLFFFTLFDFFFPRDLLEFTIISWSFMQSQYHFCASMLCQALKDGRDLLCNTNSLPS